MINKFIVAGSGTDVGKTIVSAILTTLLKGDYWKPIQSGHEENLDTYIIKNLIDTTAHQIHSPSYTFKTPLSPHHAARLENISINLKAITPPKTKRPLIIESIGGVFVPILTNFLTIDLFKSWNCKWVIVSKHYLGSINHTLLTIEALKKRQISIAGIIFNGDPNSDTEAAILENSKIPFLGRLLPESSINSLTIQRYAKEWQQQFHQLLPWQKKI